VKRGRISYKNKKIMPPKKMPPKKASRSRRRALRTRITVPAAVAEVVGSVAGIPPAGPLPGDDVRLVLEMVVLRRGLDTAAAAAAAAEWVAAVHSNLMDIGVTTLRELVEASTSLNVMLDRAHHRQLHGITIVQMMQELARLVQWPGDEEADAETSGEFEE
jgi:hypothetical protein